jgi:opacity protein-like surface antigen
MRRIFGAVGLVLLVTPTAWAQTQASTMLTSYMVLGRFDYQLTSDSAYKDVYGNGEVSGAEVRIPLEPLGERLAVWIEGGYRHRTGELSYTAESTKITIATAETGVMYRLGTGKVTPYVGAGLGYHYLDEKSDALGTTSKGAIGFCGTAGITVAVSRFVVLDARLKYNTSKMSPADVDIDVGGLTGGIGFGVRF